MIVRSLLLATALLAAASSAAFAQSREDFIIAAPVLRANITVASDMVRIGDVIDNAGPAAQIAIYRAPDLGTTGSLPVTQVLATLRSHQVIGVDTRDVREISVTRRARTLEGKEIEGQVARALEHKNGLGDAANLSLTFDRDNRRHQAGSLQHRRDAADFAAVRPAQRPLRHHLRDRQRQCLDADAAALHTGSAVETVETAVLTRGVERNEILKASDVVVERRAEGRVSAAMSPAATRAPSACRHANKSAPASPLKLADLGKPDLVQRDQSVTLIYEAVGLYLTIRGKALEGGTEGDVVSVLNLQSKRTISGVVTGRGQVTISGPPSRLPAPETTSSLGAGETDKETVKPVSIAANSNSPAIPQIAPKAE